MIVLTKERVWYNMIHTLISIAQLPRDISNRDEIVRYSLFITHWLIVMSHGRPAAIYWINSSKYLFMCFQFHSNSVVKRYSLQHNMAGVKWVEVPLPRVASRQLEVEHQKTHFSTKCGHNYFWHELYWWQSHMLCQVECHSIVLCHIQKRRG